MGRPWPGSDDAPKVPEPIYYSANVDELRDRFGIPLLVGDAARVVMGSYINRTGIILDCNVEVRACAVFFPGFGTRVIPSAHLQR